MNIYQVSKEMVTNPEFVLNSTQSFNSSKKSNLVLPARSITAVTSYSLKNTDNGIILQ
jgi:hypothetical protein